MTTDHPSPEEVQAQVEREYVSLAYSEEAARIGAYHRWIACVWCGIGLPASHAFYEIRDAGIVCRACANRMDFLDSEANTPPP